jgi:hypothetical protein
MCRMRRSGLAEMHFWFRCYRNPYFGTFLARRRAGGTTKVRHLFSDIRHSGCTGSDRPPPAAWRRFV